MERSFAVLGGDRRQRILARLLRQDGCRVRTWGLEEKTDLSACTEGASCVILPLPVTGDGETLFSPLSGEGVELDALWPLLKGKTVLAGNPGTALMVLARLHQVELLDYFRREEVQIANAVPTAEGAIAAAMEATDITLQNAACLVVGFGRIGTLLAQRLAALGARVTVSARRLEDLAWIRAFGWQAAETARLEPVLPETDLVFNTVPARVLEERQLALLPASAVVLELASAPGGVDRSAASALGLRLISAGGLPGKAAPASAAAVLRDAVYHILEEREGPM